MENKRIFLSSPTMHTEEMEYIQLAFDTNWVAPLGANVTGLEEDMAAYTGIAHGAALSAGTAAIHMAFKVLGIGAGDIVFCSSLTFSATANPITYVGAVPVFIDSEEETWNMDPKVLRKAFEKHPEAKAVISANLYGTPAKLDELAAICQEHKVPFVEDAAESLGATYQGRQTGSFGEIGIFSYNGNKIITTSGGGMMMSDNEAYTKKAVFLSTQAREPAKHYEHKEIGYNYRMSNIVAGIGRGQMKHLDEHVALKRAIHMRYEESFADIPEIQMNPYLPDSKPNFWLSCMTLAESSKVTPAQIGEILDKENIETRPIWKPMHLQPVFAGNDFIQIKDGMSVSEDIFNRGICLPSDIKNTQEDMDKIIKIIRGLFGK